MRLQFLTHLLEPVAALELSLEPARLRAHYQQTPLGEREAIEAGRNLTLLLDECDPPCSPGKE
jgi:hypothetical protein